MSRSRFHLLSKPDRRLSRLSALSCAAHERPARLLDENSWFAYARLLSPPRLNSTRRGAKLFAMLFVFMRIFRCPSGRL
jgi:hypothetical protein